MFNTLEKCWEIDPLNIEKQMFECDAQNVRNVSNMMPLWASLVYSAADWCILPRILPRMCVLLMFL